jgi:hypothetical protein
MKKTNPSHFNQWFILLKAIITFKSIF